MACRKFVMDINNYLTFANQTLGIKFNDPQILVTAFTHRSYINEHKKSAAEHNERLEFLGDAVLELVVTEFLYRNYKDPEGVMTNWRSALVRTESIGAAAKKLGFAEMVRLSRGEKRGTDRAREQILANCFESVVGAIYLDQGYDVAAEFINKHILTTFNDILKDGLWLDHKSRFQEAVQSKTGVTPVYKVLNEEGPDHDKEFTVGAFVGDKLMGKGAGPSKQAAQQEAARLGLEALGVKQ